MVLLAMIREAFARWAVRRLEREFDKLDIGPCAFCIDLGGTCIDCKETPDEPR